MTLTCCVQRWAAGDFNWLSSDPAALGMRLLEAFAAFAATVNPTAGNEDLQLTVLRNHASAIDPAVSAGFVWRLGHPVSPVVVSFHNVSVVQGYSSSSSSAARCQLRRRALQLRRRVPPASPPCHGRGEATRKLGHPQPRSQSMTGVP